MTDVRIVTEALGGSPLSLLLQRGDAPAGWCASAPRGASAWRDHASDRLARRDWSAQWRHLEPALAATGNARERLERVQRENGIVVTTGQQPGLFGGPIYTWSKAMSALALADAIEAATGIPCAPVFWAATDDADFAEASVTMFARVGGVDVVRRTNAPAAGTPMSLAALGDTSTERALLRSASGSSADGRPLDFVDRTYGESPTVGDAYVSLLRDLLEPLGVAVLDASHEGVRRAGDEILRRALECAPTVERALQERRKEIEQRGFVPQVEDMRGLSVVFTRENGIKRRISVQESASLAQDSDCILSPNVLLRPLVEASILPTVAYLGGPGEVAYFAQVGAVAQALGVEQPVVLPRWSCTLIEPHVDALLLRFGVGHDALARPDALETDVARSAMSAATSAALTDLRAAVDGANGRIGAEANAMGMRGALEGAGKGLHHRIDRLERRLLAAIKRRERDQLRDVATLRAALYPSGKRQERALNLLPMLSRHGLSLLDEMREAASDHARALIVGE